MSLSKKLQSKQVHVVVLLLQSGRFAGGVFEKGKCVVHRAIQHYTVRKGQGKAQSSQDQKRRPKSVGSQLRRAGEQSLREDVQETLTEWRNYIASAELLFIACPKTMRTTIYGNSSTDGASIGTGQVTAGTSGYFLSKDDVRIRKIPFDIGRPTFENVKVVHQVLMGVEIRAVPVDIELQSSEVGIVEKVIENKESITTKDVDKKEEDKKKLAIELPLTPLHHACKDGNLTKLLQLLKDIDETKTCERDERENEPMDSKSEINQPAGYDCMTPLHFAAASSENVDPVTAAACVSALLVQGADPSIFDARLRPAYFLATHDKVRDSFRQARAVLGEEYCDWDGSAKVGPPLTDEDLASRKEKEAEKKRRKKARQKEKKTKEKAQAQEMEERRRAEEESKRQAEETKRVRDGLSAKPTGDNVCDYCHTVCKGKKRKEMFQRLDYKYCSSNCVQSHKRELMAAAAMSRFGG